MIDRSVGWLPCVGKTFRDLIDDVAGATAIEYVLILSLIFLVVIGAISATGDGLSAAWASMAEKAVAAMNAVGG